MAATTGQGRGFTTFLIGLLIACVGIAYYSTGMGKPLLVLGLVIFAVSLFGFLKIKPLEGKTPMKPGAGAMKLIGAVLAALGWVITLYGMHVVDGTTGRLILALVGIAVSLTGMLYVLPAAFNKNAIWKA
jgi:hypothetical protein